jgi:O-methyltransferase involved in polyketide biosynthesis
MEHACFWIVDYLSPQAMKLRRRGRVRRAMRNAPFKFAPDDWFAFFREQGWRVKEMRYYLEEAARHGRPIPLPRLARWMLALSRVWMGAERRASLRMFGGYALLEPE